MYTVSATEMLQMAEVKPHETLLSDGALTIFKACKGKAMFVSHQWIGNHHPDPEAKQFRILQNSLTNILAGKAVITVDLNTEVCYGTSLNLSCSDFTSKPLFVWYDYFSCPQLEVGLNSQSNLQKAVDSIPSYVMQCDFFVALVPTVENSHDVFDNFSWAARGWCRVEQAARELSETDHVPWLVIRDEKAAQVALLQHFSNSPGEGNFTMNEDRARITPMLERMFLKKLLSLLQKGEMGKYRLLLNREKTIFRGLPHEPLQCLPDFPVEGTCLEKFLQLNGFRHALERDSSGLSPLCYAAINGNPSLVEALLNQRADPMDMMKKDVPSIPLLAGLHVLELSARFKNHDAMKVLIAQGAKVDFPQPLRLQSPLSMSCVSGDVEGIRLLLERGANPHVSDLVGTCPTTWASSGNSVEALEEMLLCKPSQSSLNCALRNFGGSNPAVVQRLLEARAEINHVFNPATFSVLSLFLRFFALGYRKNRENAIMTTFAHHHYHATPLMAHLIGKNWDVASLLITARADLEVRNYRGKTAADLALEVHAPDYVLEALGGNVERCESMLSKMKSMSSIRQSADNADILISHDHFSI